MIDGLEPPMPAAQPPAFVHMSRIVCEVDAGVSLGGPAKHGERRYVPLGGGCGGQREQQRVLLGVWRVG